MRYPAIKEQPTGNPRWRPNTMNTHSYTIRPATLTDAGIIAGHRVAMFRDMGEIPTAALAEELLTTSTAALTELLREDAYVGWLAIETDGRVIAGAGAHIKAWLPRIADHGTRVATSRLPLVVNVYTEPDWRGKGIARALMKALMDWSVAQGFDRVLLHASDAGRPLYVSLGFSPTNEMRWSPELPPITTGSRDCC
jgi:GNAT superfamily N-acetyltransferase